LTSDVDRAHNPWTLKRNTRAPGANTKRQTQIRMDDEFKSRIEAYQRKMSKQTGTDASFADAARSLINRGLEAVRLEEAAAR
jgi:hypothetical protein